VDLEKKDILQTCQPLRIVRKMYGFSLKFTNLRSD